MRALSLYERLGGEEVINLTVDRFYDRVSNDEYLQTFFKDVDFETQRKYQKSLLTFALSGYGSTLSADSLCRMRKQLLGEDQMSALRREVILGNLDLTLEELGVAEELISEAAAIVSSAYHEEIAV